MNENTILRIPPEKIWIAKTRRRLRRAFNRVALSAVRQRTLYGRDMETYIRLGVERVIYHAVRLGWLEFGEGEMQ